MSLVMTRSSAMSDAKINNLLTSLKVAQEFKALIIGTNPFTIITSQFQGGS
ncbi:hypothetical protein NX059_006662 [Plenodomus lindquistii]|nr:hypothetical protein NX059_006662 [Plenodomus lindquistii]